LIKREKFEFSEKDTSGKAGQVAKFLLTFNEQFKETYRADYVASINGGNGGAGGNGGKGGLSGKIIIKNLNGDNAHEGRLELI